MYALKYKKPKKFDYDLIIIGTGAGGGVVAHLSAKAGKKVAVIEANKLGGECPNFGCVPTKALLQAAETYRVAKTGAQFGIHASAHFDYQEIRAWKNRAVKHTGTSEGEDLYKAENIDVIHGYAHFLTPWTLAVGDKTLNAAHYVIATGTKPVKLPIPGLEESGYITYYDAIDLAKPPKSLFIIGGGAIGSEFADLFATFGTKIHIADIAPRLIALEDKEVGDLLGELFEKRGIQVHADATITRVEKQRGQKVVSFKKEGKTHQVVVEEIMVSSGKAPNTDLGLENAGVAFDKAGIKVKRTMQTSAKHIYAAGDVVGPYRFTHTASYQSRVAAHNLWSKNKVYADYHAVPRCVFVTPEIACVGLTEEQLKAKKVSYQVGMAPVFIIGKANTTNESEGFVKVLADKHGKLLGASIMCPRAGEVLHELALAVQHGLRASDITETIHAFPTWSEAVRLACQKIQSI